SKERKKKRAAIESTMGSTAFLNHISKDIESITTKQLSVRSGQEVSLEDFCRELVADIDSYIPGILDLTIKPLSSYITSGKYKDITSKFFDIASEVISKMDSKASQKF